MFRNDEVAGQLLAEYITPMVNMNIPVADAVALLSYLAQNDGGQ